MTASVKSTDGKPTTIDRVTSLLLSTAIASGTRSLKTQDGLSNGFLHLCHNAFLRYQVGISCGMEDDSFRLIEGPCTDTSTRLWLNQASHSWQLVSLSLRSISIDSHIRTTADPIDSQPSSSSTESTHSPMS